MPSRPARRVAKSSPGGHVELTTGFLDARGRAEAPARCDWDCPARDVRLKFAATPDVGTRRAERGRRTGRDFGFVPWAGAEERLGAIARWRGWLRGRGVPVQAVRSTGLPPRPEATAPSSSRTSARAPVP